MVHVGSTPPVAHLQQWIHYVKTSNISPYTSIVLAIQLNRIDYANEEIVLSSSMDIIETLLQIIYDRNGKGVFLLLIKRIIGKNFCM